MVVQEDENNNFNKIPTNKLISQMEELYDKYTNINDSSKNNEIKERANDILIHVVKGLEEGGYNKQEIWLIFDLLKLHKKICILAK